MTIDKQLTLKFTRKQLKLIIECIDASLKTYDAERPLDQAWLFNARQEIRNLLWEDEQNG